jgi:hypothetical protein
VDGRTLVPLRFVSKAIGASVAWDEATRIITIQSAAESVPSVNDTSISDIASTLNKYLSGVGSDYFGDSGIAATVSLSGSKSALTYTVMFDFGDADDYDKLTDLSQEKIESFLKVFKTQITSAIIGTAYEDATVTEILSDSDESSYYVTFNGSSYSFSWDESDVDLSDIADTVEGYFEDAGDDYFNDDGIAVTVSLSGDESDLAYTVKLDFDDASDDYDDLTDVSENDIESFMEDVESKLSDEIDGTDYEDADITGKVIDNDDSSYYVKYDGSDYTYSWD